MKFISRGACILFFGALQLGVAAAEPTVKAPEVHPSVPTYEKVEVVSFDIYAVQARSKIEHGPADRAVPQTIPDTLKSIRLSLTQAPFSLFEMIDHQTVVVPLRQKSRLRMAKDHVVVIRPLFIDDGRLCLWVKWRDKDGMEVLDSRLYLVLGESVIAGVEEADNAGLLLAMKATVGN